MALEDLFPNDRSKAPEFTYFDHLYNEYLTFESEIGNADLKNNLRRLVEKRQDRTLTWNDIHLPAL